MNILYGDGVGLKMILTALVGIVCFLLWIL